MEKGREEKAFVMDGVSKEQDERSHLNAFNKRY